MTSLRTVAFLIFVLIVPGVPAAAQQQPQTGRMMGQGWMMGSGMMHGPGMTHDSGMPGPMMGGPGQHIEGRLAFLKAELKITPQQEKLWSTYAEAVRASAEAMQGMHDQMMSSGSNPVAMPERMQWHEKMLSARLEALKKLRAVALPLYETLSAEQKQTADNLMWMM